MHNELSNHINYSAIGATRNTKSNSGTNQPAYITTNGKKMRIVTSQLVDRL